MSLVVDGLTIPGRLGPLRFTARPGEVTALVGPNGAGKSTAIRAILGLVPAVGRVEVGEARIDVRPASARGVGWVPQRSGAPDHLTVDGLVSQGRFRGRDAWGRPSREDARAVAAAVAAVGLGGLGDRALGSLSGGERQRALVARALASEAPVLLCDEPTASLDLRAAWDILALLRRVAVGRVVVVVLHDLGHVLRVADRAVVLHGGRQEAEGAPAAVLTAERLAAVWGVRAIPGTAFVPVEPAVRPAGVDG